VLEIAFAEGLPVQREDAALAVKKTNIGAMEPDPPVWVPPENGRDQMFHMCNICRAENSKKIKLRVPAGLFSKQNCRPETGPI
jgi:hypothetical protein